MIYDTIDNENGERDYDAYSLHDLSDTVRRTARDLRPYRHEFDCIVVVGMSGVTVGVPVSLMLKVPVVILRKSDDDSHQGSQYGGVINRYALGERALFVDDFSSTGDTERGVMERVASAGSTVVATYWYREGEIVHHDHTGAAQ